MKLFVVVLSKLSAGLKAAQACHAMRAFGAAYPDIERDWFENHNNIVVLQHDNIPSLAERLEASGVRLARFFEPDLDDAMTAFCAEPLAKKHLANLPLAC